MTSIKSRSTDWALWFYWIIATTVGWMVGKMFFSGIPIIVSGVAISAFQAVVLYKRIHKAWRWAAAGSLGWIAGYIIYQFFFFEGSGLFAGLIIGALTGISEWFILKEQLEWAGWWIIISIIAWMTGLVLVPGLLTSGSLPGAITGFALIFLSRFSSDSLQ